jgi:hypothetical protein
MSPIGIEFHPFACGSCVTCNPAPTDTDEDYLVLITDENSMRFNAMLMEEGWIQGGSVFEDSNNPVPPEDRFQSFTHGRLNIIATRSRYFYRRFVAATWVAQRLNLLDKADRIALFQAVLYGNAFP